MAMASALKGVILAILALYLLVHPSRVGCSGGDESRHKTVMLLLCEIGRAVCVAAVAVRALNCVIGVHMQGSV